MTFVLENKGSGNQSLLLEYNMINEHNVSYNNELSVAK